MSTNDMAAKAAGATQVPPSAGRGRWPATAWWQRARRSWDSLRGRGTDAGDRRSAAGQAAAGNALQPDAGAEARPGGERASATRLQQRAEPEIREALGKALLSCQRGMVHVGIFSLAVNLLILVVPIY